MEIQPLKDENSAAIVKLTEALTDWFDEDARKRAIPNDLRNQDGFVALTSGKIIGFVTTFFAEGRINIGWLGVHPEHQRKGIGAELLRCAGEYGRKQGVTEIATYTLGDAVEYEPYTGTRKFYFKLGFKVYQTNKTDNPSCLEEIKIKKDI